MANRERAENQNPNIRPKQVLLVGLGGVGSRTVNEILNIIPEECKRYTHAVAVDTDLEELDKLLPNIPKENKIALGGNIDTNQSITIGDYIRKNPSTTDWFVEGKHLEIIEKRNTSQGAKQVRMVSKIALAATNDSCGMQRTLNSIISEFNKSDGASLGRGLLVMVVCSIAGGTGAGTVLQFPLYLEQAVSEIFPDEDVQIECSMLLPGLFSRVQSTKNFNSGKTNAYAVIRELMSLNTGKIKRGDLIPRTELGAKAEKISPYSRVLFFDNTSMAGDTLGGDLDTVYIPKIAKALNEYLFGSVSGKITSALDNTLSTVYESGGTAIFSSVGSAKLVFPRSVYTQYSVANWITEAISRDWLEANKKAREDFLEEKKKAVEQDTKRPDEKKRTRELFCQFIDLNNTPFYRELKKQFEVSKEKKVAGKNTPQGVTAKNIAEEFWKQCETYIKKYLDNNAELKSGANRVESDIDVKAGSENISASLQKYREAVEKAVSIGYMHEKNVVCPSEAENGKIFGNEKDTTTLYGFIKSKKLHPLMIKYFLCKLYEMAKAETKKTVHTVDENKLAGRGSALARNARDELNLVKKSASSTAMANFAEYLEKDIDLYLEEYEDMFDSLALVINKFEEKKKLCIKDLPTINDEDGSVLAGGKLSMLYTWRQLNSSISSGEDVYTIDDDLDLKVHEIVYKGLVKQINDVANVKTMLNGEPMKIRTRYESILDRELLVYYTKELNTNYSHIFPKNVIEAALLECGLRNAYTLEARSVDSTTKFDFQTFIDRNPKPHNVAVSENGLTSDADYLSTLISATVGKGKPFCGRVENFADEDNSLDYTNRLLIINRAMLRTREDMTKIDDDGIPATTYIEHEIIDGVSSSRIDNYNLNTKFVDDGISPDEIISVTSISGLLPMNFVAFLPPDSSVHAPTKEHSYYSAYKTHINDLTTRENFITPHLHRSWHQAGLLDDLTASHTRMYNDEAAKAFVYGFAYDLISIREHGVVEMGKNGAEVFYPVFEKAYTKKFNFLSASEHSQVDESGVFSNTQIQENEESIERKKEKALEEKRNVMDELLVKIYNHLATSAPVREAIIAYCDAEFEKNKLAKKPDFVLKAMEVEDVDKIYYKCLLDVIGGYYQGTRQLAASDILAADSNTQAMLNFLLEKTFEVAEYLSNNDAARLRGLYDYFVNGYYDTAVIDDEKNAKTTNAQFVDLSADMSADEQKDRVAQFMANVGIGAVNAGEDNDFVSGNFSRKVAREMVDIFLNKN